MKLRLKGNSLRARLTRTEVLRLAANGNLESQTDFGHATFTFSVVLGESHQPLSASIHPYAVVLHALKSLVEQWAASDQVGLYGEQSITGGHNLTIALEKDFRCLDPRLDEDESDHFDHPMTAQSQHGSCGSVDE